ncbi:Alpha-amylase, partial [Bifidobacterium sp. DSM 109960]
NTIYAAKPSGWGDLYAYVYTGDGATAVNNAAWPGVKMTATTATDGCHQSNAYKYVVPTNLAKDAKVIFNDGGSQQLPGSREPGITYNGGIVKWDGATAALPALDCPTDVPVTSVSVSGSGVSGGKLSLKKGASAQLSATVSPSNATDRTVAWSSSNAAVASVDKSGKVTGVKAGTAKVTAKAGGRTAVVEVTVEDVPSPARPMTVYYKAPSSWKSVKANYRVFSSPQQAASGAKLEQYCDGWWRLTIADTKGAKVKVAFTDGRSWDDNSGKYYYASGSVMAVSGGEVSSSAPSCQSSEKQPMTVWYKAPSSWSTVKANWRVYSSPQQSGSKAQLTRACDGWWRLTIADTKGAKVKVAFTDGRSWDDNGGKYYYATGSSMAVAGGQFIGGIMPNCAVTSKK